MAGEGWGEKNLYREGGRQSKIGRGVGGGGEDYVCLKSLLFSQKSVRPRTEFLIGAVRLQLSITSQMCYLSVILTVRSSWRKRKMANSDCELVSFYSTVEETLNCLSEFNVGKKKQFLCWFQERIYWPCCQLAFGKAWYFRVGIYERNNDGKPSSVVVVCSLHRIVRDHNGMNIFDRINCSYDHGLSFGGYRMRQISTRICLSRERFGEAIFFVDEKNTHTVSQEFSGLHQTNYGR